MKSILIIIINDNHIKVILPHAPLAVPKMTIMDCLVKNVEMENNTVSNIYQFN
ncbi:hypothetical protein [Clostridium estertheticum]|uniref:hypothetical protein n=1 Tax=Clostridium estertheticum TaxID=238834 RepID=UPI001C7D2EA8|nr:hypothetical protein [Clostridium estertheticum]MBX4266486.1 hypothetical protein [Clostridium estertheticum]WLC88172.1 hypothetical protein KTC95_19470 [Clostridium estertheticum]